RFFQGGDGLLLSLDRLVVGLKPVLHVHAQLALGQVPDMAHGRHHLITRSKVLADGLGLGRGLYNDQICLCCHVTTSNSLDMRTGTDCARIIPVPTLPGARSVLRRAAPPRRPPGAWSAPT